MHPEDRYFDNMLNDYLDPPDKEVEYEAAMDKADMDYDRRRDDELMEMWDGRS